MGLGKIVNFTLDSGTEKIPGSSAPPNTGRKRSFERSEVPTWNMIFIFWLDQEIELGSLWRCGQTEDLKEEMSEILMYTWVRDAGRKKEWILLNFWEVASIVCSSSWEQSSIKLRGDPQLLIPEPELINISRPLESSVIIEWGSIVMLLTFCRLKRKIPCCIRIMILQLGNKNQGFHHT